MLSGTSVAWWILDKATSLWVITDKVDYLLCLCS